MSGITIKDLIRIAKKGESDDRELVVAWNQFDPDYEGGSAESDLLADRIRETMPQPMHVDDPTGEFHWELIDRIREAALDPEEEINRLNLDWEHDPVDHCKHTGDAITTEDMYKAVACSTSPSVNANSHVPPSPTRKFPRLIGRTGPAWATNTSDSTTRSAATA